MLARWRSRLSSALGWSPPAHHKSLGRAPVRADTEHPTVDAVIWVLVDSEGRYVADADPEALIDEYAVQVGNVTFGRPTQLVKLVATLPIPRTIEMRANVGGS